MPLFTVTRTSAGLSTSLDYITVLASSTKPLRIYVADFKGDGTASAANEVLMARATGASGGSAITPVKVNSNSAAASFTVTSGGSSTPGDILWRFSVNANGGIDKMVAIPGAEIQVPVSGQISIRSTDGTSNMIANLLIEEVDG